MKLSTAFTGTRLKEYRASVGWRECMNYAAAVGDTNAAFFDDERAGGIIAHPMFSVALTWPVVGNLKDFIDADSFPGDIIARQVHFTEHLELHSPLRPGMDLSITGSIAAILPHRAGTHAIVRLRAADAAGNPVFTEHIGGLMRGVECEGENHGADDIPHSKLPDGEAASSWNASKPVDPLMPFLYDGCTGIYFPIHTSKKFAHMVGLPDIILQGTATLALAVSEIIAREAAGEPEKVSVVACKFTDMVIPGGAVSIEAERRNDSNGMRHVSFRVINGAGRKAISDGYVRIV